MKFAAKDLPLYSEFPDSRCVYEVVPETKSYMECLIAPSRRAAQRYICQMMSRPSQLEEYYNKSAEQITGVVKIIDRDPNVFLKAGVITVSGLGGIVLGYRGGVIKKFSYMILGSGTAAALIYPNQVKNLYNWVSPMVLEKFPALGAPANDKKKC